MRLVNEQMKIILVSDNMTQIGSDSIDWNKHWSEVQTNVTDADVTSLSWVVDYLPKRPCSVLEIGCGIGRFCNAWSKLNIDYYGLDFSEVAISKARQLHPNNQFIRAFAYEVRMFNMTFDIIFTNTFLQHVANMDKNFLFEEIPKVLKPEGLLILSAEKNDVNTYTTMQKDLLIEFLKYRGFQLLKYEGEPINGFVFRKR